MLLVRERMPLRLHASVRTPEGNVRRWGPDERLPDYVLDGLVFSSTAPGGFEQASNRLARKIVSLFPDLEELSTVTIRGVGGEIAWQGRLEGSPRTWGDQSGVQPSLVGWQSHLQDDNSARMIYVDQDRSVWQAPSVQRLINLTSAGTVENDPSSVTDQKTGYPSVLTAVDANSGISEAWYDANGIPLSSIYYAWKKGPNAPGSSYVWAAELVDDDIASLLDTTANLNAAGPGQGTLNATTATRKWALAYLKGSGATLIQIFWTVLAVYGNHGLALYGGDYQNAPAVLASDVIAHAVRTWAPLLTFTTGAAGTIVPSAFQIAQLAFRDPTTVSEILKGATAFDLQDWFVWDGPTFWWHPRGYYGRSWRAPVGSSQLQEVGPSISRLWNGVVVTYTDVSGIQRSVGPPGSGANIEDVSLLDSDTANPANQLTDGSGGVLQRWGMLQMGTATASMAIRVGAMYLQEQKLLDTSGQATITGHVQDDTTGIWYPAWMMRAGDTLRFPDASDTSPRRIIRPEWNDGSKQSAVSLDSPPDGLQQLLERLSVDLMPLGF